jgi:iron complex outermembrane receptor protein
LFPSALFSWKINEARQLSLSYGRRLDRPTYDWINPFIWYADPYTSTRGNPFLKPQYTQNVELAFVYSKWLTSSVSYSHTQDAITNTAVQDIQTHSLYFTYLNFRSYDKYNFALIESKPIAPWFNSINTINVYYSNYQNSYLGGNFNQSIYTLALNSQNSFEFKKGWTAELIGYYISKDLSNSFLLLPRGNIALGIGKKILQDKGSLTLSVMDILWTDRYRSKMNYLETNFNSLYYEGSRKVLLTFTFNFGRSKAEYEEKKSGAQDELNRLKK